MAGVDACGFLRRSDDRSDHWELLVSRHVETTPAPERLPFFVAPAALATQFGKPVTLDSEKETSFQSVCNAWSCRSLVAFPLRKDRDIVGALVFGKQSSHPFTPV
ncbi:MAG TPA: hypothetical protein VN450_04630, partial [Candidatus Methylomirabilis sp.]|nr:hypothetical protein [Candidatus Methylomirabilis sp.]